MADRVLVGGWIGVAQFAVGKALKVLREQPHAPAGDLVDLENVASALSAVVGQQEVRRNG